MFRDAAMKKYEKASLTHCQTSQLTQTIKNLIELLVVNAQNQQKYCQGLENQIKKETG